ncbi:universal stress protein [Spirosoma arcticum]
MQTILFSADFTESTTNALSWAQLFARHYKATLVLVHVQQVALPDATLPVAGELGMGVGVPMDTESTSLDQLTTLADQLRAEGLTCQTDLRRGALKDAILSAAQEHNADLIITGRSHLNNFFDRIAGTVATGVARGANCPVLVVPAGESETATQPQVQTIVFTTPLEFDQQDGFKQALDMARTFGATLRVLHVRAENQPNLTDDDTMIGQLQTVYGSDPLPVDTVDARTVSGGIETYLSDNPADLLVMTTRERDFLSGLLNPSLTGRMVVLANLPVLVFQAEANS